MAASRRKTIVDAVVALLAAMHPDEGYNLDWTHPYAVQKVWARQQAEELPLAVVSYSESYLSEDNLRVFKVLALEIGIRVDRLPGEDEDAIEDRIDEACSDVERALLTANRGATPILSVDGVERLRVVGYPREDLASDGELRGLVRVEITYRHSAADPTLFV